MISCPTLTNINAPKATELYVISCPTLTNIDAPKAKDVYAVECPNVDIDNIIRQLANPQKLNSFIVDDNDITQDIKNADRELNASEYIKEQNNEAQFNTFIGKVGEAGNTLEGTMFDLGRLGNMEFFDEKASLFNSAMNFHGLKHEDLDRGGIHYQTNQENADERIKNYKKQTIAEKTNAHTDMRNAKSTGRVRDDVPVRSITL